MSGYSAVPSFIHDQIRNCSSDAFYVAKSRKCSRADLAPGALSHLELSWDDDGVHLPSQPIVPPLSQGRWSKRNVNGWVKVRKDLPKYQKTVGVWLTPNFGDPSKGYHTYSSVRDVYPRETWYGQRLAIKVAAEAPVGDSVQIGFVLDRVFDRTDLLERDLLMACSLIRENTNGQPTIIASDLPVSEWLRRQTVAWEILPIGEGEPRPFAEIVRHLNADPDSPRVKRMGERYTTVHAMRPTDVVVGEGEFSRYFGFLFRDDLVALECLDYGNALYLMYEDWRDLSRRSRVDLLSNRSANFDRITHRSGWAERLASCLRSRGHNPR